MMRVTAMLFHDIVPAGRDDSSGFQSPDANIYKLDLLQFRKQLDAIASQSQLRPQPCTAQVLNSESRRLLMTFDDGGVSAALYTAPILEEIGWPGHFFVTTNYIGLKGFLNERQLRELRSHGHLIGSHSCSHPARMSACSAAQLDLEWRGSIRRLEDILLEPVTIASVPGGYYSRKVASAAAAAGIRFLFTSEPVTTVAQVDGCSIIGRFSVQQWVTTEWVSAVVKDRRAARLKSFVAWNGKKILKAIGGPAWLRLREAILAKRETGH